MKKIIFEDLPYWYRLTWLGGIIVILFFSYVNLESAYFRFVREPNVDCETIGKLKTQILEKDWKRGQDHEIFDPDLKYEYVKQHLERTKFSNKDHDFEYRESEVAKKRYVFYFYLPEDHELANRNRLLAYKKQCRLITKIIGELHPEGFSYHDHISTYSNSDYPLPQYVVNEDTIVYELSNEWIK